MEAEQNCVSSAEARFYIRMVSQLSWPIINWNTTVAGLPSLVKEYSHGTHSFTSWGLKLSQMCLIRVGREHMDILVREIVV